MKKLTYLFLFFLSLAQSAKSAESSLVNLSIKQVCSQIKGYIKNKNVDRLKQILDVISGLNISKEIRSELLNTKLRITEKLFSKPFTPLLLKGQLTGNIRRSIFSPNSKFIAFAFNTCCVGIIDIENVSLFCISLKDTFLNEGEKIIEIKWSPNSSKISILSNFGGGAILNTESKKSQFIAPELGKI